MSRSPGAAFAALLAAPLSAGLAEPPTPEPVDAFVQDELGLAQYRRVDADLDGDGRAESLIYATAPERCGSSGCNLYVLAAAGGTVRVVTNITIVRLPVTLLPTRSNGWHDLGITVAGGGIVRAYMARLRYDGRAYPSNPTVPPAEPLAAPAGQVLLKAE